MSFLVVSGITVPIAPTGAVKKAPERAGNESRTFIGSLRSTTRWTKRNWQFTTKGLLDTDAAALEAAVNPGSFVTCSGDALGGASVSCLVTCGDGPYVKVAGGFKRTLVLTLREV